MMSQGGNGYSGKSSAHWFDAEAFDELIHCSGDRLVRDLVANLDGCTGGKAGAVTAELRGKTSAKVSRDEFDGSSPAHPLRGRRARRQAPRQGRQARRTARALCL